MMYSTDLALHQVEEESCLVDLEHSEQSRAEEWLRQKMLHWVWYSASSENFPLQSISCYLGKRLQWLSIKQVA